MESSLSFDKNGYLTMTRNERPPMDESNKFGESKKHNDPFLDLDGKTPEDTDSHSILDLTPCEGSDSGVDMATNNVECCRCRSTVGEADSESDVIVCRADAVEVNSSTSVAAGSVTDELDEFSFPQLRKLSLAERETHMEYLCGSYDAASENGSESSSVDDSKKCRTIGGCIPKPTSFGRRQTTPSTRPPKSSPFPADSIGSASKTSPSCKRNIWSTQMASFDSDTGRSKQAFPEIRNRGLRSYSGSRARITTSPEAEESVKWSLDTRLKGSTSRSQLSPGASGFQEKLTVYDTYATLPRRKPRELNVRADAKNGHRDLSLNRAASLRKKFLETTLMTTSMNAIIGGSSSPSMMKMLPANMTTKPSKTKIYVEVASQTALTSGDVDEALSTHPFNVYNDTKVLGEAEYLIKKRYEEQLINVNEELKKLKKENGKQRTVIDWLEGELASAKDEKCALHNKCITIEERIQSLFRHKAYGNDILHQLKREFYSYDSVIAKQQEEITDLQSACNSLKQELDRSHTIQRTIDETHKANEAESLELQEFLQAEKLTLTDSLKDIEKELTSCRTRLTVNEQSLASKQNEIMALESTCGKLSREKQALSAYLSALERRCRELLLHQGAAISSASVALSGLGSRFDQLLEKLITAYNITESDLYQDEYLLKVDCDEEGNEGRRSVVNDCSQSSCLISPWLVAMRDVIFKTLASIDKRGCSKSNKISSENIVPVDQSITSFRNETVASFSNEELNSRRNSILSDLCITDDNLTLDLNMDEALNDISNSRVTFSFLKDCPDADISLVEQAMEVDKQVTMLLKAFLIVFSRATLGEKQEKTRNNTNINATSMSSVLGSNDYNKREENSGSVPEHGSAIAFLLLLHKTVTNLLSVLHQMQDAVDGSNILKKIQSDLQDVNEKCNTFFSAML